MSTRGVCACTHTDRLRKKSKGTGNVKSTGGESEGGAGVQRTGNGSTRRRIEGNWREGGGGNKVD